MLIDIHQHLIYGMDDGAKNRKRMFRMLDASAKQGVGIIVATVHVTPGAMNLDMDVYRERLAEANEYCRRKGLNLKVCSGSEILYTSDTVRCLFKKRIPTIAHRRTVLLEFPIDVEFEDMVKAVRSLRNNGYQIVLAHAERYYCLRKIVRVIHLREQYDVMIQINAHTVVSRGSIFDMIWKYRMFKGKLVDVVASDSHNLTSRPNYMKEAYLYIKYKYGVKTAKRLCVRNPYKVVSE